MLCAVLGPGASQWHSARHCLSGAIHCAPVSLSSCQTVWVGICIIGGMELYGKATGTPQRVVVRMWWNTDEWVTDGRVEITECSAACIYSVFITCSLEKGEKWLWDWINRFSNILVPKQTVSISHYGQMTLQLPATAHMFLYSVWETYCLTAILMLE